jgi:hypothetical protein
VWAVFAAGGSRTARHATLRTGVEAAEAMR